MKIKIRETAYNRRHAIIAGFSFPEALFSRRKFIFSGENSVRFAATSHGGKPLALIAPSYTKRLKTIT